MHNFYTTFGMMALAVSSTLTANAAATDNQLRRVVRKRGDSPYPSPKRGICYKQGDRGNQFLSSGKIGWGQGWAQQSDGFTGKWYPMLWGTKDNFEQKWPGNVDASNSQILFGFNEPEELQCPNGQSCMSVPEAVEVWKKSMAPFKAKGKILVSPAVSWGKVDKFGDGPNWLKRFLDACPDSECHVDEIALHWYGDASWVQTFKDYITDSHTRFGNRNIWITEMRVDSGDANAFFKDVLPWLDGLDYVKGYAYYKADDLSPSDGPGQAYLNA